MNISLEEKQEFLKAAEKAAKLGGNKLIEWMGKVDVREKGPRDLVTQADFESQQAISDFLLGEFPIHEFLGEESTDKSLVTTPGVFCWVVDPLDGTVNYVHQLIRFLFRSHFDAEAKRSSALFTIQSSVKCFRRSQVTVRHSMENQLRTVVVLILKRHSSFAVSQAVLIDTIRKLNDFCESLARREVFGGLVRQL